jgi:hypothetical protein
MRVRIVQPDIRTHLEAGSVKVSAIEGRAKAAREANLGVGSIGIPMADPVIVGEWWRSHGEDVERYLMAMFESYYQATSPSASRLSTTAMHLKSLTS